MIRKAKRQLHAVRDDVVKKQLQVVREEIRQKQRHGGGSGVGLKFSDIDHETQKKSHWMDDFEDDDVSHLLSTNQSYVSSGSPHSKKKPVRPNLPATTSNSSEFDALFAEEDHFGDSGSHGNPLLVGSQISTKPPASRASSSQQKEVTTSLFEDDPVLGDVLGSLSVHSKHDPHGFSSSNEYEDLFSESSGPILAPPKQEDLFKDHSPKQTLGFVSSGEYDSLFSDSSLSSSPIPNSGNRDGHMTTEEIVKSPQDSKHLLFVNGTSDTLPSGHKVADPVVSSITHNSSDETTTEEQMKVHPEVSVKECGDSSADKVLELLSSSEAQFSEAKLPETELISAKPDSKVVCEGSVQYQEEEEMCGLSVASLKVSQGPLLASITTSQEGGQENPSSAVPEEGKSIESSMEFLSHLDVDSSASASPLPPQESAEVPIELERQLAQEVLEVEHKKLSTVDPSELNDKPLPCFPSESSLDIVIKLPHNPVEPTNSSFVEMSDVSEHPLLGGDTDDSLNDWSLPAISLPQSSFPHDKPCSRITALEITEDFYSQSPTTVRKEVSKRKTNVGENPCVSPSSSPQSQSSSQQQLKKSTVGKIVPVVPPRPPHLSSSPKVGRGLNTGKRQDSDAFSITSLTSVVSNDSVFLRDASSIKAGGSLSSSISSASKTSVKRVGTDTTESNVQLNNRTSEDTVDAQNIRSTSELGRDSGEATVASEGEEVYEFDHTLLILMLSILGLYLYYALNPFVYLAGFLSGFLMFYLTVGAAFVTYVQHSEREEQRRNEASKKFPTLPKLDELPNTIIVDFESYRTLESKQMYIVHQYHPNSHHPNKRISAKVLLYDDFMLTVRYRSTVQTREGPITRDSVNEFDLRTCSVLNVPEEVAQNRKRRWSKKFPILVCDNTSFFKVYLFVFTSRDKEEWFRRLRHASAGKTYDDLRDKMILFNRYMGKYMPKGHSSSSSKTALLRSTQLTRSSQRKAGQRQVYSPAQHELLLQQQLSASVTFSANSASERVEGGDSLVSIKSTDRRYGSNASQGREQSLSVVSTGASISPTSLSFQLDWINAGMARLVWDVWHEEYWRKWVTSRIQRKLVRIKTPSYMEQLTVTDVHMGMDMPTIKGPFRSPELNHRGIWVYLVVEYKGNFTMTINTKLKLNAFDKLSYSSSANGSQSPSQDQSHLSSHGTSKVGRSKAMSAPSNPDEGEDEISSGSDEEGTSVDSHSLEESIHEEIMTKDNQPEPSSESSSTPQSSLSPSLPDKPPVVHVGRKRRILNSMVSKLQHMAVKSKMIQRAAEKVSKQPLVLTVKVNSLDGYLAVNMAPPPSDALWFGFVKNPRLSLDAKPKLGQREVTLSYVTDWIEKKLCEVVEKKLVLPNMEDLIIPILTSGLPEDKDSKLLFSPS